MAFTNAQLTRHSTLKHLGGTQHGQLKCQCVRAHACNTYTSTNRTKIRRPCQSHHAMLCIASYSSRGLQTKQQISSTTQAMVAAAGALIQFPGRGALHTVTVIIQPDGSIYRLDNQSSQNRFLTMLCPVVTSSARITTMASMAMRPFHVSAERVQPHCQMTTGDGSVRRSRSYAFSSASRSPAWPGP